jgi:hypothetical protein
LSAKFEALPTWYDIYVEPFRLLAITFGPLSAVLLVGLLVARWG